MSGFKAGVRAFFALDNGGGTLTNLSPYMDTVEVPQSTEQIEVTTFGTTTARQYIGGFIGGEEVPFGGPYDAAVHAHFSGALASQIAGTTASFTFMYGPGGSVSGEAKVTGEAIIKKYSLKSGVGGRSEWSGSIQVTGAFSNSTF